MTELSENDLPPLQYAVLELLAARYRLGHEVWTVHSKLKPALVQLARRGLVGYDYGIVPHSFKAWLTESGQEIALADEYVPPILATRS